MRTSYYAAAAKLDRQKHFLVRTSLGSPRFMKCDAAMPELMPRREFLELGEADYRPAYVAMLEKIGVPALKRRFAEIAKLAGNKEIVLLCFEALRPDQIAEGQFCHRRMFADWWREKTGERIDELAR